MNVITQKNFVHGLQNARSILSDLERSIQKSHCYERRLLKCRSQHSHSHSEDGSRDGGVEREKESCARTETANASRSQVDVGESWSTMSIVCLQYQYEELSKRYEALLRAYDERCSALSARDEALQRLRQRVEAAQAHCASANKALLTVGEKYLRLRRRGHAQRAIYREQIKYLQEALRGMLRVASGARLELDAELARKMAAERDATQAVLLAEIRKCNRLYLENMLLKSNSYDWDSERPSRTKNKSVNST